jgi:hypothetical protein
MQRLFHLFLLSIVSIVFFGCRVNDRPPKLNTPEPPPHNGVFVNGKDTLWMNGDGKTIRWHFEKAVPEIGQSGKGEYVFLLFHGKYRYDAAEYFRIINTANGNADYQFSMTPGNATPEGFTIFRHDQDHKELHFTKVKDN